MLIPAYLESAISNYKMHFATALLLSYEGDNRFQCRLFVDVTITIVAINNLESIVLSQSAVPLTVPTIP